MLVSAPRQLLVTNSPRADRGGYEDWRSWGALMEEINEVVGEPLHLLGDPLTSIIEDVYEKQPVSAPLAVSAREPCHPPTDCLYVCV